MADWQSYQSERLLEVAPCQHNGPQCQPDLFSPDGGLDQPLLSPSPATLSSDESRGKFTAESETTSSSCGNSDPTGPSLKTDKVKKRGPASQANHAGERQPAEPEHRAECTVIDMEGCPGPLESRDAPPQECQAPPLPKGKKYHVFMSYCSSDAEWVRGAVQVLEREHGLKCSFHERDFHPGKTIVANINEHIELAVKTVIVLTPEFLENEWCSYETEVVMHLGVDQHQDLLVPVLLKNCDIPSLIRPLTYLDARGGDVAWAERLVAAVTSQGSGHPAPLPVSRSAFFFNPHYYNLDKLCTLTNRAAGRWNGFAATQIPAELGNRGISIPSEHHKAACRLLDSEVFSLWDFCMDKIDGVICIFVISRVVLFLYTVFLYFFPIFTNPDNEVFLILFILISSCLYATRVNRGVVFSKRLLELMNIIPVINKIYSQYCVLAGVTYQNKFFTFHKPKLHLFFFNTNPCKRYLAGLLYSRPLLQSALHTPFEIRANGDIILENSLLESPETGRIGPERKLDMSADEQATLKEPARKLGGDQDSEVPAETTEPTRTPQEHKEDEESTLEDCQALAMTMLLSLSPFYLSAYLEGSLKSVGATRHNRDKPCLCQFAEQRLQKAERKRKKYGKLSTSVLITLLKGGHLCEVVKRLFWRFKFFLLKWNTYREMKPTVLERDRNLQRKAAAALDLAKMSRLASWSSVWSRIAFSRESCKESDGVMGKRDMRKKSC